MTNKPFIIGTRGSDLAIWQAKYIQNLLNTTNITSELKIIITSGDKNQSWLKNFDKSEGKNFFTKELEDALLNQEIDIAVHSCKDVETLAFSNHSEYLLTIAGLSKRHTPNDILILHPESIDKSNILHFKKNAVIGTSSARRYAQIKTFRPDAEILPLRGNVPTRIQKFKDKQYDGIILAQAGVERLEIDLRNYYIYQLPLHYFVPAAGQGIIAIQIRKNDKDLFSIIQSISDKNSETNSKIEREIFQHIGGGCSQPIGIYAENTNHHHQLYISFNDDKNQASLLITKSHKDSNILIQEAKKTLNILQNHLKSQSEKKIFISKKIDENSYLKKIITRLHWQITDYPLIKTEALIKKPLPYFDWIFFNSKNAIKHYIEIYDKHNLKNKSIACISESSALLLEKEGITPNFIGKSNDINQIAEEFIQYCKKQTVLFPCSSISKQSIENIIQNVAHSIHFPIYQTITIPQTFIEDFDFLVFTSPSNARAFFQYNTPSNNSKIIALGKSTYDALLNIIGKNKDITLPVAFDDIAIVGAILGLL